MVVQRPLVLISGDYSELPPSDTPADITAGVCTAGSGLNGGGNFSSAISVDVSIAPAASGLIFVGTGSAAKLADDGSAQRLSNKALASGVYALEASSAAVASGTASNVVSEQAILSGTAAIQIIDNIPQGTLYNYEAGSTVVSGVFVGLNQINKVEPVRQVKDDIYASGVSFVPIGSGNSNTWSDIVYASGIDRLVLLHRESLGASYGFIQVLTTDGTSLVTHTPNQISATDYGGGAVSYNYTNNVFLATYMGVSSYLNTRAFTLNTVTNQITAGTNKIINSVAVSYIRQVYNPDENNFICTFIKNSSVNAYGIVVSGTTAYNGNELLVDINGNAYTDIAYSTTDKKAIISYRNGSIYPTSALCANTITASGVNLYLEAPRTVINKEFNKSYSTSYQRVSYNGRDNNFAFAWTANNTDTMLNIVGARISGTSIELGSEKTVTAYSIYGSIAYNPTTNSYMVNSRMPSPSGSVVAFQLDKDLNATIGTQSSYTAYAYPSGTTSIGANTSYNEITCDTLRGNWVGYAQFLTNQFVINSGVAWLIKPETRNLPLDSNGYNQIIGVAQNTAASGSTVQVRLPGSVDTLNTGLTAGSAYYVNPTTSGLTTSSTKPTYWSGGWEPVGTAVSSSALLLTETPN